MKFGIILLSLIVLLLLTAVLPVGKGMSAQAVYYSPMFILLLALLCGGSVWCCCRRRFSLKQAGFYMVHLGVVAILAGAFIGYLVGEKGTLQLFMDQPPALQRLMEEGAGEMGFEVGASDFQVEFYPPVYHLYHPLPAEQMEPGQMPFAKVAEYDASGQTFWNLDGIGRLEISNLWDEVRGEWALREMLDSGSFLHRASQTPSHYGVTLNVMDKGNALDLPISINHPAGYNGWRFYLMSYDQVNRSYVVLSARRDPGRKAVFAGIWVTMVGTFVLGFRRKGGAQ